MSYFDQNGNQLYQFYKSNPRSAYVPPAPTAPPAPPTFALFNTKSNRAAAALGAAGMLFGLVIICGGMGAAVASGAKLPADPGAAKKAAPPKGASPNPERGEQAALMMKERQGAAPGYGGVGLAGSLTGRAVAGRSPATGVHNRL